MSNEIKLLLADDHTLFREGLKQVLELQADMVIVGEASNGNEAIELSRKHRPDIVLMDIDMPEVSGIEATRIIKQECEDVNIIILTMYDDDSHIFEAIKEGANGYILKGSSIEKLVSTIKAVSKGESFINSKIALRILSEFSKLSRKLDNEPIVLIDEFTLREKEILDLLAKGFGNRRIANRLEISEKTVKNHVSSIYKKLYCHDRGSAVMRAIKLNLVDIETEDR
ncbi:MAG: response regulator transcription factor [Actinobacteria bacterium]|nr:response regulator transcription factor [Actinomycetota bacterium]